MNRTVHVIGVILLMLVGAATVAIVTLSAKDWPQWRGAERLGLWTETGILEEFPDGGLTVTWRVPINGGYSGPAVADGRVFVLDYVETEARVMNGTERLLALSEETGEVLWSHEWETTYRMLMFTYATGPRATPTVDGDRVYVTGSTGRIFCLNAETGAVIWDKDTVAEYDTNIPVWGTSSAPLVDGDRVIFLIGGEPDALVMAFDKHTGEEVWRALESRTEMGYTQPLIIQAGGARQLIVWHPRGLSSLNPETGELYWEEEFTGRANMTVADAVKSGSYLFVSGFYSGSLMMRLDLDRPAATALWKGKNNRVLENGIEVAETSGLHSVMTTPLVVGDHIYGIGSHGQVRGLLAETGERVWEAEGLTTRNRWGSAYFIKHEDRYFVYNENGDLIIVRFSPDGYVELDRTHLLNPTSRSGYGGARPGSRGRVSHGQSDRLVVWAHPAFANRHIVLRNDEEIIRVSMDVNDY
ncbi:MAG: PQQ-like beta-propeller repeat protein [Vicinamibacterales bacterium]|nr:PQQ-like beta-propeller repeat protein [Vicinamibacterales bacterium]